MYLPRHMSTYTYHNAPPYTHPYTHINDFLPSFLLFIYLLEAAAHVLVLLHGAHVGLHPLHLPCVGLVGVLGCWGVGVFG